jgi:hypothetical protein
MIEKSARSTFPLLFTSALQVLVNQNDIMIEKSVIVTRPSQLRSPLMMLHLVQPAVAVALTVGVLVGFDEGELLGEEVGVGVGVGVEP